MSCQIPLSRAKFQGWKKSCQEAKNIIPPLSMEGPWQVSDYLILGFCVLRVPWYVFCCLECKNIAYIVDFLRWADLPPHLIKDSKTPTWWGLRELKGFFGYLKGLKGILRDFKGFGILRNFKGLYGFQRVFKGFKGILNGFKRF